MKVFSLLAAATLLAAVAIAPRPAPAAGTSAPSAPSDQGSQTKGQKPKKDRSGATEEFMSGYRLAYSLIYDNGNYAAGIAALRDLGYDDHPDVANLLGYASRKLGRYDDAKYWYERALAADPNHALTWSYYGMWQVEQGNMLKAKDDLEKVRLICGDTDCRPYRMLKDVIEGAATY